MGKKVRWAIGCGLLGVAIGGIAFLYLRPVAGELYAAAAHFALRKDVPARPTPAPLSAVLAAPDFDEDAPASTPAGHRILATLGEVEENLRTTRYQHRTRVREGRGEYLWDCSGMTGWVLRRSARRAFRALGRERPVARTFARCRCRRFLPRRT